MDLENQFQIEHLFLDDRKCKVCEIKKNLIDGFYRTRKNYTMSSSYSYECKECTIKRVQQYRKKNIYLTEWQYPDW